MRQEQSSLGFWQLGAALGLGLVIGGALGWTGYIKATTTWAEEFSVMQSLDVSRDGTLAKPNENAGNSEPKKYPVAEVVGIGTYNFGVSQPGVMMEHTFIIRNRGEGPLELTLKETTCKCLTMTLDSKIPTIVQPGEELPVTLQFKSEKAAESFVQMAKIKTNDPHLTRNTLKLQVEGRIVSRTIVRPYGLEVSDLMSSSSSTFNFNLYTFAIDDVDPSTIQIETIRCDNALLNEKLKFTWQPLSEAEILAQYQAKGGFQITGIVPQGMPMNMYAANIFVKTSDGSESSLGISIKVKAPVTIRGLSNEHGNVRFFEEAQYIDFGIVKAGQTAEMDLLFNYRTDKKGELEFNIAEISHPDLLDVEIADTRRTPTATIVRLRVAIRADAPPTLLNGPKRDKMANVKIMTNSVEAPAVNLAISVSKN
ncbi:MAG: DUF1573 domain-containing protein [Pirellulaceae bacterium]|nr:DUF1573 domain-containing protein [Pirellulaceae bacterium]